MRVKQYLFESPENIDEVAIMNGEGFVLVFSDRELLENRDWIKKLSEGQKDVIYVSTAGEIYDDGVTEGKIVITDFSFQKTKTKHLKFNKLNYNSDTEMGKAIYNDLEKEGLKYVWMFSDGHLVNGENVINGFEELNENHIHLYGGLAGDGNDFNKTIIGINQCSAEGDLIVIAFYGDDLVMNSSYGGGWWQFGPLKKVTKSVDNIVYEINGKPALDVYKKYLGPDAEELPSSALLFPLCLINENQMEGVVRTILSIDEGDKSMTFAGNIPEGSEVKMMRATLDDLMSAAYDASEELAHDGEDTNNSFVLAVSCVGRKLVYESHVDDEFYSIKKWFPNTTIGGFFSYGEICPNHDENLLHNQTLTLTELYEK